MIECDFRFTNLMRLKQSFWVILSVAFSNPLECSIQRYLVFKKKLAYKFWPKPFNKLKPKFKIFNVHFHNP